MLIIRTIYNIFAVLLKEGSTLMSEKTEARMAESVDALVSNTSGREAVPVRPRLRVQISKFFEIVFGSIDFIRTFALPKIKKPNIEIWCNGSTTDSGSVSEGSNPSISTNSDVYIMAG